MAEISINTKKIKFNAETCIKSIAINLSIIIIAELIGLVPLISEKVFNRTELIYLTNIRPITKTIIIVIISLIFSLLSLIFYSSVKQGQKAWYSGNLNGHKNSIKRLIFWIKPKYSFKAFLLNITINFLKLIWFIIFCTPSFSLLTAVIALAFSGGVELYLFISLLAGCIVLFILGTSFTFIVIQRYFLAGYLLSENPKNSIIRSVLMSKNLMEGQLFEVVKLKLKFIPSIITFPLIIPIFFIHYHYKQCCCILANKLRL